MTNDFYRVIIEAFRNEGFFIVENFISNIYTYVNKLI